MVAEELVLLARDDKAVSLAVIPGTTTPSPTASEVEAAEATFRLVVEQSYRCDGADEVDTMEDVACRVPVAELRGAAAVDRAFDELLAGLDHPTLRPEVVPEARRAAERVRARCAEEGDRLGGVEFRLRVVFVDSFDEDEEPEPEPDREETGSDLELDEESWSRGRSDGGDCRHGHDPTALCDDEDDGGAQFSARTFGGALARAGGPSDGTLLLSGFEARADGPEPGDQHELTSRDVQRLVRLAFSGGDVEGDEGYQRAVDGGTPVSRVACAVILDQGLRSATQRPAPSATRGMPPRMRTGW